MVNRKYSRYLVFLKDVYKITPRGFTEKTQ